MKNLSYYATKCSEAHQQTMDYTWNEEVDQQQQREELWNAS